MTPEIVRRLFNVPLAIHRPNAEALLELLRARERADVYQIEDIQKDDGVIWRSFDLVNGIAVIPIHGILVHGEAWWGGWGEISYQSIDRTITEAIADPEVRAIAMHINSPGGEVAGCFDLAEKIAALRRVKPIWAILDECAYSAAYALACAAEYIVVPRTGGTGSIGVIAMRVDITGMLEKMGVKIHTLKFGAYKTDTYPEEPLTPEGEKRLQADVDTLGEMFVSLVAKNRGMEATKIKAMQAGTFLGEQGKTAGLADAVMNPQEAFRLMSNQEF
jgi:capsid assembly protease